MIQDADQLRSALACLPHGPEFRFVDRLTSLEPGRKGEGVFVVKAEAAWLKGHFPGEPIMPGVLLAEAIAQLAGVVAQCDPVAGSLPNLKLTALRNVKILGVARPGDTICLKAEITGRLGNLVQARGTADLNGIRLAQAEAVMAGT